MLSAERPGRIISCFAGPSLLAGLAVQHFADHWLAAHPESRLQLRANESNDKAAYKRALRARRRKALERAKKKRR